MAFQIIRSNIINVEADAIVNTANPKPAVGQGVDYAIYKAAGWDRLLKDRAAIGEMLPGEVACTPAYDLKAKFIIHAIGPAWLGGDHGERETVAACYSKSLMLAAQLGCESIAFPLIATGTYGFPKDEALRIAIREISRFLLDHEMEVMLVVYDKRSFEVSGKLFSDIRSFIAEEDILAEECSYADSARVFEDRAYIGQSLANAAPQSPASRRLGRHIGRRKSKTLSEEPKETSSYERREAEPAASFDSVTDEMPESLWAGGSLEERIKHLDKTFQEYLLMLIDRKGMTDPEVYKKANIDRKHFSKIRSNADYNPSKRTALALAIALELSLDETRDLLMRAGLAISPSSIFDKIIEYCIDNRIYDIYDINCILFEYDQPLLGA